MVYLILLVYGAAVFYIGLTIGYTYGMKKERDRKDPPAFQGKGWSDEPDFGDPYVEAMEDIRRGERVRTIHDGE